MIFEEDDDYKSRSQKKRESTALQRAGEELSALSAKQRKTLGLPKELGDALDMWANLKTHEAKRRQMQFIGKLMREADDIEKILEELARLNSHKQRNNEDFHLAERTRTALIQDDESARELALQETLELFPHTKMVQLRHLVQATLNEREKKRPPKAFRELFRYLQNAPEKNSAPTD